MEEYIESELSSIFPVKLVAKNIMLGCLGTHVMHMRVKLCQCFELHCTVPGCC